MQNDRVMTSLSLAQKAGQVKSGGFSVEQAIRDGSAYLVIVAGDASENTKKKMKSMTDYYQVPLYFYSDKEHLGRQIGKEYRSMAAVTGAGFAAAVEKQLKLKLKITTE